jgi:hypothetical protein
MMRLLVLALTAAGFTAWGASWLLLRCTHHWGAAERVYNVARAAFTAALATLVAWWLSWVLGPVDPWPWVRGGIAVAFWLGGLFLVVCVVLLVADSLRERSES